MKIKIIYVVIAGMILLSGCYGMSANEKYEAIFYATAYAKDGVIPPAKYQTLAATALNFTFPITATPSPNPNWTPTLSGMEWSATQAAQVQNNALTAQANQQAFELEKLKAEQAAQNSENTAVASRATAEAYSLQQTAEARAAIEATSVSNTQVAAIATNEYVHKVNNENTAVAAAATNAVLPTHAIWTQNAVYVIQTVEQGNADKVALAVKRQETKNMLDALAPWSLVIVAAYVLGKGLFKWLKHRTYARDEHGRQPLLTIEDDQGNVKIIKPEILPKSIVSISATGNVQSYELTNENEQADINRRAQAVDALAVLPTPYAQQGAKIMNAEFGRGTAPRVNFHDLKDQNLGPVLDEADSKFLENTDE